MGQCAAESIQVVALRLIQCTSEYPVIEIKHLREATTSDHDVVDALDLEGPSRRFPRVSCKHFVGVCARLCCCCSRMFEGSNGECC
mmetsp:Transcript_27669/g.65815  ORF Transcript_27669/g.65815 Transcript_27669/m.65815 type:complete len:86 (-) Transcript_27669:197-454(-)